MSLGTSLLPCYAFNSCIVHEILSSVEIQHADGCFSNYMLTNDQGDAKEVSKITSLLWLTAMYVRTGFLVRTGLRCVICLKYDQTCTPGHRPAIQTIERDSRSLASSHAFGPEQPIMPRRTCLIEFIWTGLGCWGLASCMTMATCPVLSSNIDMQ